LALHPYPRTTNAWAGLPSCVIPLLAYYQQGSRGSPPPPEGFGSSRRLAPLDSAWAIRRAYGNINPLSIDYACRPRLRSRLTLGGLAWPRNPWSFGGRGSHLPYRYSCLHSHSHTLHHSITPWLHRMQDAPLPNQTTFGCRGFGR